MQSITLKNLKAEFFGYKSRFTKQMYKKNKNLKHRTTKKENNCF